MVGLRSNAIVLAERAPCTGASSAAAAVVARSVGISVATVPVATTPTAAADAMTAPRTVGTDGGGVPAMR